MAAFIIFITYFLIFVSYPDTTPLGPSYLFILMLISIIFYYIIKPSFIKLTYNTKLTINLLAYTIMLLFILISYPQSDSKSVLYKIITGKLPDRLTVWRGLKRLGIDFPFILKVGK